YEGQRSSSGLRCRHQDRLVGTNEFGRNRRQHSTDWQDDGCAGRGRETSFTDAAENEQSEGKNASGGTQAASLLHGMAPASVGWRTLDSRDGLLRWRS